MSSVKRLNKAQDHLGTGRFVYNQAKTQTAAVEHCPCGERYNVSGTAPYHEFTGKPWDADANMFYFPYRYYRPDMDRWTTPDPAGLVDGLNVYGYVKGDPFNKYDPDGRFWCMVLCSITTGIGCGAACTCMCGETLFLFPACWIPCFITCRAGTLAFCAMLCMEKGQCPSKNCFGGAK